jgi:hypothetical protein
MGWFPLTCETFPFSAALGERAKLTLQSVNQILKIQTSIGLFSIFFLLK